MPDSPFAKAEASYLSTRPFPSRKDLYASVHRSRSAKEYDRAYMLEYGATPASADSALPMACRVDTNEVWLSRAGSELPSRQSLPSWVETIRSTVQRANSEKAWPFWERGLTKNSGSSCVPCVWEM